METNFQGQINSQTPLQPKNPEPISGGNNQNLKGLAIGIIIFLVMIVGGVYVFKFYKSSSEPQIINQQPKAPIVQNQLPFVLDEDSTASVSQQLNDINISDIDDEFKDIDADISNL